MSVDFQEPIPVGERLRWWRSLDLRLGLVALADRSGCRPDFRIVVIKSSGAASEETIEIVGNCFGGVMHDLADLRGGLALKGKPYDLRAVCEHGSEVVVRASHGNQDAGMGLAYDLEVAGDGPRRDEEDAVGEVFRGEESSLTEGLLAEVEQPRLPEGCGAVLMDQEVVDLATMQSEADGLLGALSDRLAGRLVSGNDDEGDLTGRSVRRLGGKEGRVESGR
jgi:hypothetical protein